MSEGYPASGAYPTSQPYPEGQAAGSFGTDTSGASLGQLMSEVTADLSHLMRQEIELAKVEIKAEATKAGKSAGLLGGAGFAGYMAVVVLSFAAVFGIASEIGLGWGALVIGLLWALIGAALYTRGRAQLRRVNPKPQQTIDTLKEDAQWARHPKS